MVTPGSGRAEIVAELSWLNCSIAAGATSVETLTTADSGTISPVTLRMKKLPSCSGLERYSLRHLHDDVVAVRVAVELRDGAAADEEAERRADVAAPAGRAPRRGRGRR